ncbi:MAG: gas vesicle protein [Chloroflexi bacterium]|nr:gas vesicle protein [Chloroflexota bacterium]
MSTALETRATLEDLLERVLDRGLVIDADLVISLAGIPLIGVKLRAMIAGIDTMLERGIWRDWDEALRVEAEKERMSTREGGNDESQ